MTRPLEILLIEDNDGDAFLISELVHEVGVPVNITVAGDGQAAMDILNKDKRHIAAPTPEVVVLDLNLPKVHGFEVLRMMKASPSLRTLPVVIMTGSLNKDDEIRARDMGVSDYCIKPSRSDDFESVIRWFKDNLAPLAEGKRDDMTRTHSEEKSG